MIRTLDMTAEAAENALLMLGRHVSPDAEIGRPLVAAPAEDGEVQIATDLAVWFVGADEAVRLLPVSGDRVEYTRWQHGVEVSRIVHRGE